MPIGGAFQMDFQGRNTIHDDCAFQGLILGVQHTAAAVAVLLAPAPGRDNQQRIVIGKVLYDTG